MPPRSTISVGIVVLLLVGSALGIALTATAASTGGGGVGDGTAGNDTADGTEGNDTTDGAEGNDTTDGMEADGAGDGGPTDGDSGDGDADADADVGPAGAPVIQVSASAEASAPPDQALVRPAVVATGDTADDARRQVAENVSEMRAALDDLGIADDQVRTTYFDIFPLTEQRPNGTEIVGYRAAQGFEVEVNASADDLGNRTGAIIDAVVGNGANQIDGVQFTLSDETHREVRRQALERATTDARTDAEFLASLENLSITGVRSMSTGDVRLSPVDAPLQEAAVGDAATVIDPGPVTVSATVSVTYGAE